jgi:CheY-like chemotaxis protein
MWSRVGDCTDAGQSILARGRARHEGAMDTHSDGPESAPEVVLATLAGTLKVLVVDDDEQVLDLVASMLRVCPLLDVTAVGSVERARRLGSERHNWHCWVLDLYVPELDDGMALMGSFAARYPIVALSGRSSGGEGYRCSQLGVMAFFDKSAISQSALLDCVFRNAQMKMLFERFPFVRQSKVLTCVADSLIDSWPESVTEWAGALSISPRTLEQWCTDCGSLKPRTILILHHLYQLAYRMCTAPKGRASALSAHDAKLLGRFAARRSRLAALVSGRRDA